MSQAIALALDYLYLQCKKNFESTSTSSHLFNLLNSAHSTNNQSQNINKQKTLWKICACNARKAEQGEQLHIVTFIQFAQFCPFH